MPTPSEAEFDQIERRVRAALLKHHERKTRGSKREPVHVKHGPELHFGVSKRRGRHFGIPGSRGEEHLYAKRRYAGNAKRGKNFDLTPAQIERVAKLFALRKSLRKKRKAKVRGHYRKVEGAWVHVKSHARLLPPTSRSATRPKAEPKG